MPIPFVAGGNEVSGSHGDTIDQIETPNESETERAPSNNDRLCIIETNCNSILRSIEEREQDMEDFIERKATKILDSIERKTSKILESIESSRQRQELCMQHHGQRQHDSMGRLQQWLGEKFLIHFFLSVVSMGILFLIAHFWIDAELDGLRQWNLKRRRYVMEPLPF
ncbi:hypothetical protein TWF481_002586 [Arthrobotrys musiformis]|uniref:Uncharacterized protein n=1 Tax=Arthrobotrys musiformis TaxID=47236 RepID=A0AAV9VQM5_9PEZI